MNAVFSVDELAVLFGCHPQTARLMLDDRSRDGVPGPYRRLPGRLVRTPARPVLDDLALSWDEAVALLHPPTESAA